MPYKDIAQKRECDKQVARRMRARDPKKAVEAVLRSRDPMKHRARAAVYYARKIGRLEQQPCEVCGSEKSEAHHEDYAQPLDVRWFCRVHHFSQHRKTP